MRGLEDGLTRTVGRLSMSGSLSLAGFIYVVFGLVIAFGVAKTTGWRIIWNVFGVAWAWVVVMSWIVAQQHRLHRRLLLEWTSDLRRLSSTEFEWLVGEVLRREGWAIDETGRPDAADGNVDLKVSRAGRRMVVQCKRWQSWVVGVDEVRKLAGTVAAEGLERGAGMFVTLSEFSEAAVLEAHRTGLTLVDNRELVRRIEAVRQPEPCPDCGEPMILGRSIHGWWFRCQRCPGKRDLDQDPGTAVDLLLEYGMR